MLGRQDGQKIKAAGEEGCSRPPAKKGPFAQVSSLTHGEQSESVNKLIKDGGLPDLPGTISQQKGLEGVCGKGAHDNSQEGKKGSESLCD